jgi:hypothetical protein
MGSGRFDADDWTRYSTSRGYDKPTTKAAHIYTSSSMFADFDPKNIKGGIRESRDSADNPNSTPIIVGLDVTGSMDHVLEAMAKVGLKTLFEEVYNRKPVQDPHVLCAAIGDAYCDTAPLQVTQFEADLRIAEQLEKLYLERGGGGNDSEGYSLLHYFATKHTACDAWEKRKKKGYLFTIGDDGPTPEVLAEHVKDVFGVAGERMSCAQILTLASRQWEVFHLMVAEGGTFSDTRCVRPWKKLLGERALTLKDHTKMAEVIVSTIQVIEGASSKEVVDSWNGDTSMVVHEAIHNLTAHNQGVGGVVTL